LFSGSGFNSKHFQSTFDQHETTTTGGSITTAVLVGLPTYMYLFRLLRSVINAAARLIYGLASLRPHLQTTSPTHSSASTGSGLRRQYGSSSTAVLMYKATHGTAPSYLSQLVCVADLPGLVGVSSVLLRPIVSWCSLPSAAGPFQSPDTQGRI